MEITYIKTINKGYIDSVQTLETETKFINIEDTVNEISILSISKGEYRLLLNLFNNAPIAEPGYKYRLTQELTWEKVEEPIIEEEEIDDAANIE